MKNSIIRILCVLIAVCILPALLVAALPYDYYELDTLSSPGESPPVATLTQPPTIGQSGVSISFDLPRGWHTRATRVGVTVTDLYAVGIKKVEAKAVQNGSWADISDTLYVNISDNCSIYVQVTDNTGLVKAKSVYVECFDRVKPTVRASRSGRLLRIEAGDDLSGVAAIFVDGEEFTDLVDGTLEYRLDTRNTKEDKIWIQAKDFAGNISATVTIANPYYIDPDKKESQQQEETQAKNTGNSTTDNTPVGSAITTTPPPSETTTISTPPPSNTTTATAPPAVSGVEMEDSADAGSKIASGVIAVGNKQFITIQTKDEKIFYLIIDGGRDSDNVYLVTEVTSQDLMSFTADEAVTSGSGDSSATDTPDPIPGTDTLIDGGTLPAEDNQDDMPDKDIDTPTGDDESVEDEATIEENPDVDDKKASPIPGWIMIALLALVAAFAGYMFLIVLPRKKAKEAYVDGDDGDEDMEEEYEAETVQPEREAVMDDSGDASPEDSEDDNPLDIPFNDDED